jgi:putative colanic acid biosynthesis acetyltransferase WcaF
MSEPQVTTSRIFQRLDQTASHPHARSEYIRRILWNIVAATLFRFSPPRAYRFRRWILQCFGAKLAPTAGVKNCVRIFYPWLLEMGHFTMLGPNVIVYNLGMIRIGDHSVISQDCHLCAGTHDYTQPNLPLQRPPITVGAGVWIAAGAFIGPGAVIGDNCVIGARSVVFGHIPPGMVAAGNPCKVLKPRTMNAS